MRSGITPSRVDSRPFVTCGPHSVGVVVRYVPFMLATVGPCGGVITVERNVHSVVSSGPDRNEPLPDHVTVPCKRS